MSEAFSTSGESSNITAGPAPQLQGLFVPGIDNSLAVDGFGIVTPWGGGRTARRYRDYGISTEISQQSTQLNDLASSLIPAEGGATFNLGGLEGPQGPEGPPGPRGLSALIGLTSLPSGYVLPVNSNFLTELPHNIDQINDLGTAIDKLIYTDAYNIYTEDVWTERQPAGDTSEYWSSMASDSDGSNLIAADYGGRLWTSSDSGVTWTERQPAGAANKDWRCVASDSDGSHLIAGILNGRLYTSANSGVDWTERQPAGDTNHPWRSVASDSDGSHFVAVGYNGRFYVSSDYGVNWTERSAGTNRLWTSVASDSTGAKLIASNQSTTVLTSIDNGLNWTARYPAGAGYKPFKSVASDSDGSFLVASKENNTGLYTSSDSGVNWTERVPNESTWVGAYEVACDSDGSNLIVSNTFIYTSTDYGVTWTQEEHVSGWGTGGVACDLDGSNLMAGGSLGRLYTRAVATAYSEATWAESSLTSAGRALLDDATAAAQATTLGLGTGDSPTFTALTLSSIAHETADVDKFLVDSTGVIKYRTGAEILSDAGAQAQGDVLDDLNTLGASASDGQFIVATGGGTLAWESGATARTSIGLGTGDSPTFAAASLGTGELTCGSINRAADTLTLEVGGTAEISITSTASTFGGNLVIPNAGYIGSVGDTDAIQIEADGDIVLTQDLGVGKTPSLSVIDVEGTNQWGFMYRNTDDEGYAQFGFRNDLNEQMYFGISGSAIAGAWADLAYMNAPSGHAFAILIDGVQKLRVGSDGKIGVGVAPVTLFTVEGAVTLKEQAAADGDTAAYGQVWVKNDAPCSLYFTDDAGNDTQLVASGGGVVGFSSRCRAHLAGNQTIGTGTWTKLQLATEDFDNDNEFDNATNYRFTATATGQYIVVVQGYVLTLGDNDVVGVRMNINGGNRAQGIVYIGGAGNSGYISISDVIDLTANDYVEAFIMHDYGSDRTAYGPADHVNFMSIHRIS